MMTDHRGSCYDNKTSSIIATCGNEQGLAGDPKIQWRGPEQTNIGQHQPPGMFTI